ncbi:MAG TPA: hypothetical protein VF699_12675 [Caulobacteraceae bacterium]|jgi:hypothetical protein
MWVETACEALRRKRLLELTYDGYTRSLEVHAVGWSKDGHALMRAWQVQGGSAGGEASGWKLMRLEEASAARVLDRPSEAPRKGYKRGDAAMSRIVCEL